MSMSYNALWPIFVKTGLDGTLLFYLNSNKLISCYDYDINRKK